jgi:hypothetical protein
MRIAIIATPRSGQTWLRRVLCSSYSLEDLAVHNWLDLPTQMPARCALGIHWFREPNFIRFLAVHDFRIVTLARHPLDALCSALHFVSHEPQTARWLEGLAGLPGNLIDCAPTSAEFRDYCLSFDAENFLAVTYQWWQDVKVLRLRYEELVAEPAATLTALSAALGMPPADFAPALAAHRLATFQTVPNYHGWHGTPGLWRRLVPWRDAWRVRARHRRVFDSLGYSVSPSLLTRATAARNWQRLKI